MISSVLEFQHTAEMSPAGEAPASSPPGSSSTGNLVFPQGFSLQLLEMTLWYMDCEPSSEKARGCELFRMSDGRTVGVIV